MDKIIEANVSGTEAMDKLIEANAPTAEAMDKLIEANAPTAEAMDKIIEASASAIKTDGIFNMAIKMRKIMTSARARLKRVRSCLSSQTTYHLHPDTSGR